MSTPGRQRILRRPKQSATRSRLAPVPARADHDVVAPPTITAVCVTAPGRSWCLGLAIDSFFRQRRLPGDELLIVRDEDDLTALPIPREHCSMSTDQIRVAWVRSRTLGEKRNAAVRIARGDVLVTFDDDDYHAPRRLETIRSLMAAGARVVGSPQLVFADLASEKRWLYTYQGARPYVVPGSMAFRREDFEAAGGYREDGRSSEDGGFTQRLCERAGEKLAAVDDFGVYVATMHPENTGKRTLAPPKWAPWSGRLDAGAEAGIAGLQTSWRKHGDPTVAAVSVQALRTQPAQERRGR